MEKLKIITNVLGGVKTNCYFVGREGEKDIIIIDPADEADFIMDSCDKNGFNPVALLLTHGHFDHILAVEALRESRKIPVYAGADEKELLADVKKNCSRVVKRDVSITGVQCLNDAETIVLAGVGIKVISTPGHTAGSVCYYIESENVLFSGDTLFRESVGRTDLPTSNHSAILHSIKQKLFELPDETIVYPGHGEETTIAYEKKHNMVLHSV